MAQTPPYSALAALLAAASLCAAAAPSAAIDIDNFSAPANDRFADDPAFIADAFDLSGVGMTSNGRWATLISRNVFVSAKHFHPADGDVVTFYSTNDPAGGSIAIGVADGEGVQLGSTDIWLGALDEPVPEGYEPFDFATEPVANFAGLVAAGYGGRSAYLFGRSPSAMPAVRDVAVGRNVLDAYLQDVSVGPSTGDAILASDNQVGGEFHEALLETGDSSGPLFVETETGLVLVGANWIVASVAFANSSGFSYLGNHALAIQDHIDAHPLPEPSAPLAGLAGAACVVLLRRYRPPRPVQQK